MGDSDDRDLDPESHATGGGAQAGGAPASPAAPASEPGFPIVGIGSSAGGLAALEAFFSAMPADRPTGMAFVLVQHLAPDHESLLCDLVRRYTRMAVLEVEDGMPVRPECVYVIPPNRDMAFLHGALQLLEPTAPRGLRLPIDFFFRSLAQDQHERAICIVLSGTGSDGTLGVRAVKGEGGLALAQDPGSTPHDGMPRSAIATGLVDYVLTPKQMPDQLLAYASHAFPLRPRTVSIAAPGDELLKKICVLLRSQTGHDFSQYKESTLTRRLERRMALHQIEQPESYLRFARETPAEVEALFRDLLIGVTSFFRDPDAFAALNAAVIPRLFANKAPGAPVRVWVCGCSTGEEAYSIAILIREHLESLKQTFRVQIFATDIDRFAIDQARAGAFPPSIAADVSSDRLARFFTQESEGGPFVIQKLIRDLLVFSEQDLIKDPPFSRVDLICCRNLLIYLNGSAQRKLIPLFHYALNPGGFLFLGSSETVGELTTLFTPVDRKWKIFARREGAGSGVRPALGEFAPIAAKLRLRPRSPQDARQSGRLGFRELTERGLLEHLGAAGVLVNSRGEILHIFGRTGQFLEPAEGDVASNIVPMAREGLQRELATALHKAVARNESIHSTGLRVRSNGGFVDVDLTVRPVSAGPDEASSPGLFLVILEEAPAAHATEAVATPGERAPPAEEALHIASLEQELRAKEEYLQTTLEEMETSQEELRSANEEMQSINEELQSTNEELETSKEELQSVNEELATVNVELEDKVSKLSRSNNDMNNLLAGTGVATLFVDLQLRVARFTPATTQIINLIQADIGRPVGHIVSNLEGYDRLTEDVSGVLESLAPREAEVRTHSGAWFLMSIRPYRTLENVIEGAVITFVDITARKLAEERFRLVVEHSPNAEIMVDSDGRIVLANAQTERVFGYDRAALIGESVELLVPERLRAEHRRQRQRFFARPQLRAMGGDLLLYGLRSDGTEFPAEIGLNPIETPRGTMVIAAVVDCTERNRMAMALRESEARANASLEVLAGLEGIEALVARGARLEQMLEKILDAAITVGGADMGCIQRADPRTARLRIAAQRGFAPDFIAFWDGPGNAAGAGGVAVAAGRRVIVGDVTRDPLLADTPALAAQLAAGVRAVVAIPFVGRSGRLFGVLSVHYRSPKQPDTHTLALLDLITRQATDALEHVDAELGLRGARAPRADAGRSKAKAGRRRRPKRRE